jgi:hypothetical protein
MRLLVNSRQTEFREALVASAPTPAQGAVRNALKHAIAMEMVHLAMTHAQELELGEPHEAGSSGRVFVDLVSRLLPPHTPKSCHDLYVKEPGKLSAEIQSRLGLFSEIALSGFIL